VRKKKAKPIGRVRQRFVLQFFQIFLFLLTITSRKCSQYSIKAMQKLCASGLKLYNGTLSLSIKSKLVILSSHFGSYEKLRHLKSCTILALSKYGGNVLYFIWFKKYVHIQVKLYSRNRHPFLNHTVCLKGCTRFEVTHISLVRKTSEEVENLKKVKSSKIRITDFRQQFLLLSKISQNKFEIFYGVYANLVNSPFKEIKIRVQPNRSNISILIYTGMQKFRSLHNFHLMFKTTLLWAILFYFKEIHSIKKGVL